MTSEYVLDRFPFLAGKAGWKAFAEAFDKPECVKRRIAVAKSLTRPPGGGMEVREMLRPANEILRPELLTALGVREIESDPLVSARKLASMVTSLFSDTPKGKELRAAVAAEGKNLDFKPKEMNGFEAMQSLFWFIEREQRLPTKKELSIECKHRWHSWTHLSDIEMPYGRRIGKEGDQIWRVISCRRESKFNSNGEIVPIFTLELTGEATWGKERWNSTDFSPALRVFGLSGLPHRPGRKRECSKKH